MMQVITVKQAKEITGGRTPLVPVEYEQAIAALVACTTLDEAKYWSDKSDALAAWAKIYHSNDAERKAKQLKLHAFRRMGQLAEEIRPRYRPGAQTRDDKGRLTSGGSQGGPLTLLTESGINYGRATQMRKLARIPDEDFKNYIEQSSVPTPGRLTTVLLSRNPELTSVRRLINLLSRECLRIEPRKLASDVTGAVAKTLRRELIAISEWLDEFEQHLPKEESNETSRHTK